MISKNSVYFYVFSTRFLAILLVAGLLAGCSDALDQTNDDINSPIGGMMRLAEQMHAEGDDQGAMEFYARAVQRMPDSVIARRRLAELLEAHNANEDAAAQYRALVDLKPDDPDLRRAYGRLLIKLGKPDEAREQYEAALKIDPADAKALNGLGIALDLKGDHAAAEEQYKAALETAPDDLVTVNNLGHSYVLAGQYDDAIKTLEPHSQNSAAPAALRQNLAAAYAMSGMDVDAARVLKADLPPDQVKKTLARYHAMRAKAAAPLVFANLGSFSTPDLARARLDTIRRQFAKETGELSLEIMPKVDAEGGTPDFYAEATGFKDRGAAEVFCKKLTGGGAFCKAHEG